MGAKPEETRWTFDRGLVTIVSPTGRGRSLVAMDNVWLAPDDWGAVQAMPGYAKVNSSEITSATFHSIATALAKNGARMNLIGYVNGAERRIIHMNPDGTRINVFTEGTSPATTLGEFAVVVLEDLAFFANGTDAGFKSTINTSSPTISASGVARVDVSSVTAVANSGTDNNVKGVVAYYISKMTGTTEGALSAKIGPVDCGDGKEVTLLMSVLATDTLRVYRTLRDRAQAYYIAQVTGGSDYVDTTLDADLGDLPFLHGDLPPTGLLSLVAFNSRVWGWTSDSFLHWTDPNEPESWWDEQDGNRAPINVDDGDVGTVLVRAPGAFLACKRNHIYRVIGNTPANLQIQESAVATQEGRTVGVSSANAIAPIGELGVAFYWNRGLYIMAGGVPQYISQPIEDDLAAIRNQDEADGVYLGYFPKRRHIHLSVPLSAGVVPTHEYIYDLGRGQWVGRRTVGFRGYLSTFDANGDEQFWSLGKDNGFVYNMESGVTAAGSTISTKLTLPPFYGKSRSALKYFIGVDIEYVPQSSGTVSLKAYLDGKNTGAESASFSQVSANYDRQITRFNFQSNTRGHEVVLELSSNADQPQWLLHSVTWFHHEGAGISR